MTPLRYRSIVYVSSCHINPIFHFTSMKGLRTGTHKGQYALCFELNENWIVVDEVAYDVYSI